MTIARSVQQNVSYEAKSSGSAKFVPQQIAVFAQGSSAYTYPTVKEQVTSAAYVGLKYGWGSPAHAAVKELLPPGGGGVGSIPVWLYPLTDAVGSAASVGDFTPSGTQTKASAYRLRIGGVLSNAWIVPLGALVVNTNLAAVGQAVNAILEMPVIATYTYGTITEDHTGNTGDGTLASMSATGSPIPGDWVLTCTAADTDAGTFKLVNPDGIVVSTSVAVTGAAQAVGGLTFTLSDGAADFIVGDTFTITVPATKLNFTSKWKGASAENIAVEVIGDTTLGTTFAITQPTGGLTDPTLDAALAQMGSSWCTLAINALDPHNATALNTIQVFGETRWGSLVHKPLCFLRGNNESDWQDATATTAGRTDDRVNIQVVAPGSPNMPHVIAAAQLAQIALKANSSPASDYGSLKCLTLTPGLESLQWDYNTREAALQAGSSTIEIKDGKVSISDVITSYSPEGEDPAAYQYLCDVVGLQQCEYLFSLQVADYDGRPMIQDTDTAKDEPNALQPKMMIADCNETLTSLGNGAIIADVAASKALTRAAITGPKSAQLDVYITLSGKANKTTVNLHWGFLNS